MCAVGLLLLLLAGCCSTHANPGRLSPHHHQRELVTLCCRRYTSPDEQAFFPNDVPPLVLPPIQYAQVEHFNRALRACCQCLLLPLCSAALWSRQHAPPRYLQLLLHLLTVQAKERSPL